VDEQVFATVVSDSCTSADVLATALCVLEPEKGIEVIDSLEGTECLITIKTYGEITEHKSEGLEEYLLPAE
jgi:thiamine biosynthesis lipoprotein